MKVPRFKVGDFAIVYERGTKQQGTVVEIKPSEQTVMYYLVDDKGERFSGYTSGPDGGDDDIIYSQQEWDKMKEEWKTSTGKDFE